MISPEVGPNLREFKETDRVLLPLIEGSEELEPWIISKISDNGEVTLMKDLVETPTGDPVSTEDFRNRNVRFSVKRVTIEELRRIAK